MISRRLLTAALAFGLALPTARAFDPFNMTQEEFNAMFQEGRRQWEEHQRKKEAERQKDIRKGKITVLRHAERCIFTTVARHMKVSVRSSETLPAVYYASQIELFEFQNALKAEYGTASGYDVVTNVFLPKQNAIYLTDFSRFYQKGRTLDDSLAHEFAHYFQFYHLGAKDDPAPDYDRLESEAIAVQEWFRAAYAPAGTSPCAP